MDYTDHIAPSVALDNTSADGFDLRDELDALQPNERARKAALFLKHFDEIEAALARQVTKTRILQVLKDRGLKLSAQTFTKKLEEERKRRQHLHQASVEPDKEPSNPTDNEEEGAP